MLTIKSIDVESPKPNDYRIDVDVDDNGWVYVKQGDDWVMFPRKYAPLLIEALEGLGDS